MRKVKTGALRIDQRTFLLHMVTEHFAQGLVHQVRGAVVAHGRSTHCGLDLGLHRVAYFQAAVRHAAMVAEHIGLDLLRIGHGKHASGAADRAFVAHLATAFGIKRRGCQHHYAALAGCQLAHFSAVQVQRQHGAALV